MTIPMCTTRRLFLGLTASALLLSACATPHLGHSTRNGENERTTANTMHATKPKWCSTYLNGSAVTLASGRRKIGHSGQSPSKTSSVQTTSLERRSFSRRATIQYSSRERQRVDQVPVSPLAGARGYENTQ